MGKEHLTLQWDPPEDDGQSPIIEYVVERREKSEKDWHVCGSTPADGRGTHFLTDDKVVEGKEYYYRVRAVNKAGPGDPCDHGNSVKIKAKPGLALAAHLLILLFTVFSLQTRTHQAVMHTNSLTSFGKVFCLTWKQVNERQ